MFSFFGLLFALRLGTFTPSAAPSVISVRAEARAVANAAVLGPAAQVDPTNVWNAGPQSPEWPVFNGPSTGAAAAVPVFRAYRPEEWVSMVADKLHLGEYRVTQAAMWLMASPVHVDLSPRHVYVTVRIKSP